VARTPKERKSRQPRVNLTSWARLRVSEEEEAHLGTVVNISRDGVGVYCKEKLSVSMGLDIEMKFFDADNKVWVEHIRGRVVRCEKIGTVFLVGIRFSEKISPHRHPQLAGAIVDMERG
jgi:hypothetical protein